MESLIRFLSQYKISKKLIALPAVLLVLTITIGVLSSIRLDQLDQEVQGITRDLAPDAGAATELLEHLFMMRLAVKDYARLGSSINEDNFEVRSRQFDTTLTQTKPSIQNPQRQQILTQIDELKAQYTQTFFTKVVPASNQIDTIQNQQLNVIGPRFIAALDTLISQKSGPTKVALDNIKTQMLAARLAVFKYRQDSSEAQYTAALQILDKVISQSQAIDALQPPLLQDALSYRESFGALVDAANQKIDNVALLDTIGPQMAALAGDLSDSVFDSLEDKGEEVEVTVSNTLSTLMSLTLIATLFGIGFSVVIAQGILRPIRNTTNMLKDIAHGEGDLTQRLDTVGKDEIAELSQYFNQFISSIQTLVSEIQSAAYQIGSASEELSVVSMQTSNTVSAQSAAVNNATQIKDKLVAADSDVACRSNDAMETTDKASREASTVEAAVVSSVQGITSLATNLGNSKVVIEQLSHDSDRIGQVLTIINSITEQINLLALNAAIEAARAGDAGRGFAVVADEVRTLAQRTQSSTEEIESSINSVITISKKASQTIDESLTVANDVAKSSCDMQQQLANAIHLISAANSSNQTIREATDTKREHLNALVHQLESVSSSLTDSKMSARQSSEASEELASLGAQLQTLVDNFKV